MRVSKIFTVVMLMASVSAGAANAKSLRNADEPAEFPPRSYNGKQYIDSKGCVFIRAGIGGNVTWVPRISQKRQQICRQSPTFAKSQRPTAPAVADVAPVVKVPAPKPAAKRVLRAPVKAVVRAPAKPVVRARVKTVVRTQPVVRAPMMMPVVASVMPPIKVVRRVADKPYTYQNRVIAVSAPNQPQRVVVRTTYQSMQTRCQAANSYRQVYGSGFSGSCSSQANLAIRAPRLQTRRIAVPKLTRAVAIAAPARQNKHGQITVRIAPRVKPPKGYTTVWRDDRLNQNRARGTAAGKAQMDMVWTNTVPRRLIAVSTNQDTRRRIAIRGMRREKGNIVVVSATSTIVIVRKQRLASAYVMGATR